MSEVISFPVNSIFKLSFNANVAIQANYMQHIFKQEKHFSWNNPHTFLYKLSTQMATLYLDFADVKDIVFIVSYYNKNTKI